MKITRDKLLRISKSFIQQRAQKDRTIICAYLTGSLLKEFPFINGTTDVDIIIVHTDIPNPWREIVSLADEVSLDIYHYPQSSFANAKTLREDPWLGSSLCFDPEVLYGKGHWFEFILASTEASFFLPEFVIRRSQVFIRDAHRWFSQVKKLSASAYETSYVFSELLCIENAMNSIACLSDKPMTLRHFIQDLETRCEAADNRNIPDVIYGLICGNQDIKNYYPYYSSAWKYYLEYFSNYSSASFYPEYGNSRLFYYLKPVEVLWEGHLPSALWIMSYSWVQILCAMKIEQNEPFHSLCEMMEISQNCQEKRIKSLDILLDMIDDTLDHWAESHGVSNAASIYTE